MSRLLVGCTITALSLLPFVWLKGGLIHISEEDNFGNYKNVLFRNMYAWTPSVNNGNAVLSNDHVVIIPAGVTYFLLSSAGVEYDVIQKIYLSAIILITLCAVAYALRIFTKHPFILLAGTLLYYFNFYVKSTQFYSAKMYQLILMPLFFAFLYKYLTTRKYIYVGLNFLFFFLFQAIFTNLATCVTTLVWYPIAIGFHFATQEKKLTTYIKDYASPLAIFFLPTVPIFLYNGLIYYFSYVSNNTFQTIKQSHTFSAITAPLNFVFQLRGAWWETAGFEGVSYNPWLWFYNNPVIVFCSFGLIAGIFCYSIYKKRVSKIYFFWFTVFIMSMLFASGSSLYQPLYKWFFTYIPMFYIFREPWAKFMPALIFATAIILVLGLRDFKNKYLLAGVIVLLLLRGIPFFSPDFYDYHSKRGYMPFAQLPAFWNEYEVWTRTHLQKTIVSIPINYFMRNWYQEDLGNINHPLTRLFGYAPIIYDTNNNGLGSLLRYFIDHQNPAFVKIANAEYALIQRDIDERGYADKSKAFNSLLTTYFHPVPEKSFGNKLFLHKIKSEFTTPRVYIPQAIEIVGGIGGYATLLASNNYRMDSAVFLKSQNRESMYILNDLIGQYQKGVPEGTSAFTMTNPTRYVVTLKNIRRVTPIVLYQSYHPDWKIYPHEAKERSLLQLAEYFFPPTQQPHHFTANGYANAWFIDPIKFCATYNTCIHHPDGTYTINFMIEYWPQRLLVAGLGLLSITSILVMVAVLRMPFKKNI